MKNKIIKIGIGILLGMGLIGTMTSKEEVPAMKSIAISQIVEHPALDATYRGILEEIEAQGYIIDKTIKISYETAHGSPTMAGQIAQKFVGKRPDVLVGLGTIASQALVSANRGKNIPIVFSSVTDPVGAQLVASLTQPSGGVTGVTNWVPLEPQIEKFKRILPKLKRLGIVYNPGEGNSVILVSRLKAVGGKMGIEVIDSAATSSAEVGLAAQNIAHKVDAIFISNDNTALSAFPSIVAAGNEANIPVFVSDIDMVGKGAVAAFGPDQYELGRQTGRIIVKILKGTSPAKIDVEFPEKTEFYLNLDALEAIHLQVPESLINEADDIINRRKE